MVLDKVESLEQRIDSAISFLREASIYFAKRPTDGEDRAFWANVYNSENCKIIANLLESFKNEQSRRNGT